jgi:hypothetical protein
LLPFFGYSTSTINANESANQLEAAVPRGVTGYRDGTATLLPALVQLFDTVDSGWRLTVFRGTTVVVSPGNPSLCDGFRTFEFNTVGRFGLRAAISTRMNRTSIALTSTGAPPPIRIAQRLADLWCTLMHDSLMWPVQGQYQCRTCGRGQAVAWGRTEDVPSTAKIVSIRLTESQLPAG